MRLATVKTAFGTTAVRIEGEATSLMNSTMLTGIELDFDDVGALLRSGDWAKAAELSGEPMVFATADLAPVVPHPEKIICVGLNYAKHIREMNREFPEHPTLFTKFADEIGRPPCREGVKSGGDAQRVKKRKSTAREQRRVQCMTTSTN